MAKTDASDLDRYIANQSIPAQPTLQHVRRIIRKVLPDAEETLSYQMPAYKLDGQHVVYFAGWKKHWSLYPVSEPVRASLGSALEPYEFSKGTVRFPLDQVVPAKLVERMVTLRKAAEARATTKARR